MSAYGKNVRMRSKVCSPLPFLPLPKKPKNHKQYSKNPHSCILFPPSLTLSTLIDLIVIDFAACALNRTLTMVWACRPQKLAMNHCMLQYQNQAEMDAARVEWFKLAGERRREREEQKRRQEEARRKHHEWWGLDEQGRTRALAEAEERVKREEEERRKGARRGEGR